MTPDIETLFFQALLEQKKAMSHYNLKDDAPVIDLAHPRVLRKKLELASGLLQETPAASKILDWYVIPFSSIQQARTNSTAKAVEGRPFEVHRLLEASPETFILGCGDLGAALLSKKLPNPLINQGEHHHLVPIWLSYALSPELWGPQGKWIRFHSTLHQLFKKQSLLIGADEIGFYPLHPRAQKLAQYGFEGTLKEGYYSLTLPWSFPLSGLKKLEEVVSREF